MAPRRPTCPSKASLDLSASDSLAAFPGYKFGLVDDSVETSRQPLEIDAATDEDGKATLRRRPA